MGAYEAVAQGVIEIVAVERTFAVPAATVWDLIVPATATTEPVIAERAKTVVAVVVTVKVLSVRRVTV